MRYSPRVAAGNHGLMTYDRKVLKI